MAIPTSSSSSDWSLNCSHCIYKTHKFFTFNSSTFKSLPFLSLPCSNSRILIAYSSSCPSPILENASTNPPVIKLDLNLQEFQGSSDLKTQDLNGFISSLFKDPQTQQLGFEYYEKAKEDPEFIPKRSTLKQVIRYLLRSKNWNSIISITEDFRKFNVFLDSTSCCRLISSCISARKFKVVNNLLDILKTDKEIAVLAFDSAMKGYNKLHMYRSTIAVYERMKSNGVVLDPGCYFRVMEAYLKMGQNEKIGSLFEEFQSKNFPLTQIHTQVFKVMCESLGKSGRPFEALDFFREMKRKGIQEEPSFYSLLICSFASVKEAKMAEVLLKEAEAKKMLRDPAVFLKLVLMYVEEGLMEKTLQVVSSMKRANIRVSDCIFCAIVNGFSKKRGPTAAIKVYKELNSQGYQPGQVTYASILNVYCLLGLYSEAEQVFNEMLQRGFDKCVVAYSSMVAMYGKTGRLSEAMRLVAKMKERGCKPNVWIYNSLLDMHGKVLNLRQVEKIWKEMKRRKIVPDKVSYTSIISAYSKAREYETSIRYYQEYRLNGGVIDRAMAGIMVGVFSKLSQVDELVRLLQDLKMEGTRLDGRLYKSSLNALRDAGLEIQAKWLQQNFDGESS